MQHGGRRDFLLQTPNKATASAKARDIYLHVLLYAPLSPRRGAARFKVGRSDLIRLQRPPRRVSKSFPARIANPCFVLALHLQWLRITL